MLIYRTAGGGGWKDRLDRPVEAVERDVAFGLVSREKALSRLRRGRRRRGGDRGRARRASGPSAATRWRSTSGRRSRRRSPLRGGDRAAGAGAGQAAALVAAGGPRVARWPGCAMAEAFGGAAGFGERPAVVVVDLNRRLHRPVVAARRATSTTCSSRRARCSTRRARAGVPVFFTTIVYDEVGEAAAAVFLRKVPALRRAAAGHALGRDRPAAGPPRRRAGAGQGARLGVLRRPARGAARRPRHADRVRRVDLGLRPRDRGRRDAARARADRAARVRRRPLIRARTSRRSTDIGGRYGDVVASTR